MNNRYRGLSAARLEGILAVACVLAAIGLYGLALLTLHTCIALGFYVS